MQSTLISFEDVAAILLSSSQVTMVDQSETSMIYSIESNGKKLIVINTPNENYLIQ
ncbi:hypothetical protein [Acinetobacter sp. VT 511]|uniref:hypothetical protein n=1 Tax=Acinetobacter sp. VT 511 TaxID=1675902 RepID=UPI000B1820FC|nr:hypothetical protein [Acinetobacter sp. VT 511]